MPRGVYPRKPGVQRRSKPLSERFSAKVDASGDCWLWTGRTLKNGYGVLRPGGGKRSDLVYAHRVAWKLATGSFPTPDALHTCDTPACVRNDESGTYEVDGRLLPRWGHLFEGTALDNARDRKAKGRDYLSLHAARPMGSRHHAAKLTDDDVRSIRLRRAAGDGPGVLAAEYGVDRVTIWAIAARRQRRHVV